MLKNSFGALGLVLAVALLIPANAFAATANPGWEFSTVGNEFTDGNWTFGEVFTADTNFTVNLLGYYDPTTGMADSHYVVLYDSVGDVLASTTVTSASTYSTAHFLYNLVTPVELIAGDTYVVEGVSNADPYAYNDGGFTVYAPITILGNNWALGTNGTFNGIGVINDVSDGEWGANIGSTVPEPGSMMLIGFGMVLLAGARRCKASR